MSKDITKFDKCVCTLCNNDVPLPLVGMLGDCPECGELSEFIGVWNEDLEESDMDF